LNIFEDSLKTPWPGDVNPYSSHVAPPKSSGNVPQHGHFNWERNGNDEKNMGFGIWWFPPYFQTNPKF